MTGIEIEIVCRDELSSEMEIQCRRDSLSAGGKIDGEIFKR